MTKYFLLIAALWWSQLFAAEFVKHGDEYVYRDTVRFEESASGIKTLSCEAVNGEIKLTGESRTTVHVTAFVEIRCENLKQGQDYLEGFKPVVKRNGAAIEVSGEYPDSKWTWDEISANMDFVILAPKELDLEASCANGEIDASEMQGAADLSCANGEIRFNTAEAVAGEIEASCANGEVDITVGTLAGGCDVSTANGEVSVTVTKLLSSDISASTANGEIDIAIPESSSFTIKAGSIVNGTIRTDWGNAADDGLFGESVKLAVNEGKHTIDCSTVNGEIEIRKSNSAH
ncbi:MAG: DUF4097 family beta strand repeat protein [Calditrichaeota bacterium]|nr:DUF4097 family beta strand repeat protein [Calditrichota bacterium]MCB9391508.1 DUF4097 family beta strand repeat protein [Calditrichota bacterium]